MEKVPSENAKNVVLPNLGFLDSASHEQLPLSPNDRTEEEEEKKDIQKSKRRGPPGLQLMALPTEIG
ncbi:unnamed protein product, partial [Protopolystoma xenopodis]